jgi:ring-1,2-phenylacetyl-CoA epoxidase subunit PaaA
MYGGGFIYKDDKNKLVFKKAEEEDPLLLAAFEAKIERGEKIEPDDWMPDEYRKQLIRMIEQHAHSEIVGSLPEGTWITRAPSFKRKLALLAKVQDEIGHAQLLYAAAETLGKSREDQMSDLLSGKSKYSNIFNYPAETWADIAIIGWLVDAAAIVNQLLNSKGSYAPYCRALERICYEESFHLKQGHENVVYLATGSDTQRAMVQAALNRWWKPLIHFFGPPDGDSVHSGKLIKWKVKMASNDDMRNQFFALYVPKIKELGLTLPINTWKNEDGTWSYDDPDWDEFYRVIKGDGPCNAERLKVRNWAVENGLWVREALVNEEAKSTVPLA